MFWLLIYPVDLIKSAVQTDAFVTGHRCYSGVLDATRKLHTEGGVLRFYKGMTPCLMRSIPANAVLLTTYVSYSLSCPLQQNLSTPFAPKTKVRAMLD